MDLIRRTFILVLALVICLLSVSQNIAFAIEKKNYFNGVEIVTSETYQKVTTRLEDSSIGDSDDDKKMNMEYLYQLQLLLIG